jgi:2-dehydro-3-deoxygluconokinase
MGMTGSIVTLGEVMALFLTADARPLGVATDFRLDVAGAEATVAIGLARLGHHAVYLGRLGDDPLGAQIVRTMRGHGVDVTGLRLVPDGPTGLLVRDASADRPISVRYYRSGSAASTVCPDDIPPSLVESAALVHLTGITSALSDSAHATVLHVLRAARDAGVPVSFDPNVRLTLAPPSRWRAIFEEVVPWCDIVLTGADDARVVTDGDPAAWFLDRGATTVVVKDGAKGAYETDGTTVTHAPARDAVVVDPVGAGDAFAAGWLGGRLRGLPPGQRLQEACVVAALAIGAPGDIAGLPDERTVQAVLAGEGDVTR